MTSEHYIGGMKHKYQVRECAEPNPDQTQYQEAKVIYIAAEEIVWDFSPSRDWERELQHLQGQKYGSDFHLQLGRVYSVVFSHACVCARVHVCACVCTRTCVHVCARTCVCMCVWCVFICVWYMCGMCSLGHIQLQITSKCV